METRSTQSDGMPLAVLGPGGDFTREIPATVARAPRQDRFQVYRRAGLIGVWRHWRGFRERWYAESAAQQRCQATGDSVKVLDTRPDGTGPVSVEFTPGLGAARRVAM